MIFVRIEPTTKICIWIWEFLINCDNFEFSGCVTVKWFSWWLISSFSFSMRHFKWSSQVQLFRIYFKFNAFLFSNHWWRSISHKDNTFYLPETLTDFMHRFCRQTLPIKMLVTIFQCCWQIRPSFWPEFFNTEHKPQTSTPKFEFRHQHGQNLNVSPK